VPHAFDSVVVEVDVRDLDVLRQRLGVDRKAMILRRDFDLLRLLVEDRLVAAAVAELELVRLAAEREPQQLMPRQMPKTGFLPRTPLIASTA
jgi:hypothetical protein